MVNEKDGSGAGMQEDTLQKARRILSEYDGPDVRIMEVCGTHTHEIFRQGIRQILSPKIHMISGPGCPVCVTPAGYIDEAVYLALEKGCTIATFGDLVRVPGTDPPAAGADRDNASPEPGQSRVRDAGSGNAGHRMRAVSLQTARGAGAKVKVVYTPLDAEAYAREHPEEQVVFLSVGFETTTPACCLAVRNAVKDGLSNFSLLTANKTMPGAYEAMKHSTDLFLYPGHVHAITGTAVPEALVKEGVSGVLAGFTARELMTALAVGVTKFREGRPFFVNCYPRVVTREGSPAAQRLMEEFMEPEDAMWRGIGVIPGSGMRLRDDYAPYDARKKFDVPVMDGRGNPACRCGEVLQGKIGPQQCPCFGTACTPEHPVGACMVSSEGACSAWYLYGDLIRKS